jgi:hypothetical protein
MQLPSGEHQRVPTGLSHVAFGEHLEGAHLDYFLAGWGGHSQLNRESFSRRGLSVCRSGNCQVKKR